MWTLTKPQAVGFSHFFLAEPVYQLSITLTLEAKTCLGGMH